MSEAPVTDHSDSPVALVTGGARRVGAAICQALHGAGYRIVLHYRSSEAEATALADRLNALRPGSVTTVLSKLGSGGESELAAQATAAWGRLDLLVNNASGFYPTPLGRVSPEDWDELMGSNARGPLFLSQALAPALAEAGGAIINIIDVHAERPLFDHPVYCMAKAALRMLTLSLARDLAPAIRVNGVSPGAILWPEAGVSEKEKEALLEAIPLQRRGAPEDIAGAVLYLARDAGYVTGQVLAVDGGRSLLSV